MDGRLQRMQASFMFDIFEPKVRNPVDELYGNHCNYTE